MLCPGTTYVTALARQTPVVAKTKLVPRPMPKPPSRNQFASLNLLMKKLGSHNMARTGWLTIDKHPVYISQKPKHMAQPISFVSPVLYPLRSTYICGKAGWRQLENNVDWTKLKQTDLLVCDYDDPQVQPAKMIHTFQRSSSKPTGGSTAESAAIPTESGKDVESPLQRVLHAAQQCATLTTKQKVEFMEITTISDGTRVGSARRPRHDKCKHQSITKQYPVARLRRWLMDTGCGFDLVSEADLKALGLLDIITKASNDLIFSTPAGKTNNNKEASLLVEELRQNVKARVCETTPNVLSIGRRCVMDGFAFHWPNFSTRPYLVTPCGNKIELEVDGYIPYLRVEEHDDVQAAPASIPKSPAFPCHSKIPGGPKIIRTVLEMRDGKRHIIPESSRMTYFFEFEGGLPPEYTPRDLVRRITYVEDKVIQDVRIDQGFIVEFYSAGDGEMLSDTCREDSRKRCQDMFRKSDGSGISDGAKVDEADAQFLCRPCSSSSGSKDAPIDVIEDTDTEMAKAEGNTQRRRNLREEAMSLHHQLTHIPKIPEFCDICRDSKAQRIAHYNRAKWEDKRTDPTTYFGERFFMDHIITNSPLSNSVKGHTAAVPFLDDYTGFSDLIAVKKKTSEETIRATKEYLGTWREEELDHAYTCQSDSSLEIKEAMATLNLAHNTSTPGVPQSNGRAERNGRTILEGTRAIMAQAGIPHRMWPWAARHFCLMRNVVPRKGVSINQTPWMLRHGEPFKGRLIPFGARIRFLMPEIPQSSKPSEITGKEKARTEHTPKMGEKALCGVFLGYHMDPGCKWNSGDYYVAELKNFEKLNFNTMRSNEPDEMGRYHTFREVVSVRRTRDCWRDQRDSESPVYPLRDAALFALESIVGLRSQIHFAWDDANCKPIVGWDELKLEDVTNKSPREVTDRLHELNQPLCDEHDSDDLDDVVDDHPIYADSYDPNTKGFVLFTDGAVPGPMGVRHGDQLKAIVSNPDRFAVVRKDLDLLGVKPEFNEQHRYTGDIIGGMKTRRYKDSGRPLHIDGTTWNAMLRPSKKTGLGTEAVIQQRIVWCNEWRDAIFENADAIVEADRLIQMQQATTARIGKRRTRGNGSRGAVDKSDGSETETDAATTPQTPTERERKEKFAKNAAEILREKITSFSCDCKPLSEHQWFERYSRVGDIPSPNPMPIDFEVENEKHRDKWPSFQVPFNCCVAEPVSKKQIMQQNELIKAKKLSYEGSAQEAVDSEWKRLRSLQKGKGTWDESNVQEYEKVASEAQAEGRTVHFGNVFNLCVLKGSELRDGNKGKKYKGRTVFQGNRVWDQNWDVAMFQELSSTPATMEASKAMDFLGMQKGWATQQADAKQAYTQSKLGGDETWVFLPEDQWPTDWKRRGFKRPVCRLDLALYGHPNAGAYWEQHCDKHLRAQGFIPIDNNDAWRSCYHHKELDGFLIVYVDDFKLSAPEGHLKKLWSLITTDTINSKTGEIITKGAELEEIESIGKFLGCQHNRFEGISPITGEKVQMIEYNMTDFMSSCVEKYCELGKVQRSKLKRVPTPFLDSACVNECKLACGGKCTVCHARCYSGNPPKKRLNSDGQMDSDDTSTQCPTSSDDDDAPKGKLQPIASRILMKVLYGARMARPDLLKAVGRLATKVTKWTPTQDLELHRLMCYIESTKNNTLTGWCNPKDTIDKMKLVLYADADFAGESDSRSTSGVCFEIHGPDTRFMLTAISKKQACVSHSTPEAEIVAADFALRTVGLPALILWDKILGKEATVEFREDNETMIQVCKSGKNPTMRHLGRTHRVSISWLHERFAERWHDLRYILSEHQTADIFTKAFSEATKWDSNLKLIRVYDNKYIKERKPGEKDPMYSEDIYKHREKKKKVLKGDDIKNALVGGPKSKSKNRAFQLKQIERFRQKVEADKSSSSDRSTDRRSGQFRDNHKSNRRPERHMRQVAKMSNAVGLAGGSAVQGNPNKRNRRRALRAGKPPESLNDLLQDNRELMNIIQQLSLKQLWYEKEGCKDVELREQLHTYDSAEQFMNENWDARVAAQSIATKELQFQRKETKQYDTNGSNPLQTLPELAASEGEIAQPPRPKRGDFLRVPARTTDRDYDVDDNRKQRKRRLKLLGYSQHHKVNPLTTKLPGAKPHRDIHTCFVDRGGRAWNRLDSKATRFQLIQPEQGLETIMRRITIDQQTGEILQDAYFTDGYINVAYQLGCLHPLQSNNDYDKDNIVTGLQDKYGHKDTQPDARQDHCVDKSTQATKFPALQQFHRKQARGNDDALVANDDDFSSALEEFSDHFDDKMDAPRNKFLQDIIKKGLINSISLPAAPLPQWAITAGNDKDCEDPSWMKTVGTKLNDGEQPEALVHNRLLLEFCCGPDSLLSTPCKWTTGCKMIRLTEEDDMASDEGLIKTLEIIKNDHAAQEGRVMLWASIPCVGGSAWNRYNWSQNHYKNIRETIKGHWKLYRKIFNNFKVIAEQVLMLHGCVVNEWPKSCEYWSDKRVTQFFDRLAFQYSVFDGCCYDLRTISKRSIDDPMKEDDSDDGVKYLIKKVWQLAYSNNIPEIGELFSKECNGKHKHALCAGPETKATENYTWRIAKTVHIAFEGFCNKSPDDGKGGPGVSHNPVR